MNLLLGFIALLLSACAHYQPYYAYHPDYYAYGSRHTIIHRKYFGGRLDHDDFDHDSARTFYSHHYNSPPHGSYTYSEHHSQGHHSRH